MKVVTRRRVRSRSELSRIWSASTFEIRDAVEHQRRGMVVGRPQVQQAVAGQAHAERLVDVEVLDA